MSAVQETREPSARFLVEVQPALVRQFELLAKAPGGVARLRDLILTLAVQGKLVKQDPSAESADQLLARVHAAKRELLAMGRIGKQKPTEPINEDETAFPLPQGWAWCRVGDLAWPQAGFAFKSTGFNEVGQGLPLIRIRDVGSAEEPTTFFSGEFRPEFVVEKGDWLISMDGEFRVRQWHAAAALLNQRVTRLVFIVDELHADFIATALQRELTALQGTKAYTTVDHLSGKQIAEAVIALPPATEQARIVARVDELMQLCDALEAKGRLEAQQHARLLETLLGTLTDSTTPEELAANWQRVAEHFDFLLDRPEAVDVLEQTVLQLATSGRFSSREPHLQTSSVELADQGSAALPFAVPADWSWISLGQLTSLVTSGSRSWKDYYSDEGATFIRSQDIKYDRLEFDNRAYVRIPPSAEGVRTQVRPRDVLITITGANVGKAAVVEGPLSEAYVSQHVALVRLLDPRIADYLHLWLVNEHGGRLRLLGSSYGAKPGLNLQNIKDLPVPMPPLEEQVRIAARVADLRRLCTDLRQRLAASQATQSRLAEALMATEA